MIASVLLGGVSIFGGRGALHGVVAGVLLIAVLNSALLLSDKGFGGSSRSSSGCLLVGLGDRLQLPAAGPGSYSRAGHRPTVRSANRTHSRPPATVQKKNERHLYEDQVQALRRCAAALTLVASLGLAGCGSDDEAERRRQRRRGGGDATTVTFIPKNLGNPYFDTSDAGGEKAVGEFGGTYAEVGPDTAGPDTQVSFIDTAAQQGVNALVVSANDPQALCDSLNAARDAGTKVVTFDSDVDPTCRDLFINQATAEGIAKVEVDMIAEQIGDAGEIAILSAAANATNQNAWIEMMEADLKENHPDISSSIPSTATTTTRRPSTRRPRCSPTTRTSRASSRRPPSASPPPPATCPPRTPRARSR